MPKSMGQKLKILYLMRILLTQTDEAHMLTVNEIISKLAECGVTAERKTVYDDIEALRQFGIDIVMEKSKSYGYYVAARDFELPELKLLVDAVVSSKFITEKKSLDLIKKLESLISSHDAAKLRRQVHVNTRVKSMNESIYYNVDALHDAIANGKKVSFKYFDHNIRKERVYRKDGAKYSVSPAALLWDNENYYLVACTEHHEGFSHYRVDKMSDIAKLDESRSETIHDFDPVAHSKKTFGMFGGDEANVTLRLDKSLIGVVIDRFGKDVIMAADGEQHFNVSIRVALSPVFYGWLFQFGGLCEVIAPQVLKDRLKTQAEQFLLNLQ